MRVVVEKGEGGLEKRRGAGRMEKRGRLKKVGTGMEKRGATLEKVGRLDGIEKGGSDSI